MKFLGVLAFLLVIVGALNWGLWGFFQFDFVAWLFNGNTSWMSRFIHRSGWSVELTLSSSLQTHLLQ
jgi:uncharacterized membrane protein YuzA (DUF378 family)